MSDKRTTILKIPVTGIEEVNVIKVTAYYSKGGHAYNGVRTKKRGVYYSVQPMLVEDKGSYEINTFMGFSGVIALCKELGRFSQAKFNETTNKPDWELIDLMIKQVMEQYPGVQLERKVSSDNKITYQIAA